MHKKYHVDMTFMQPANNVSGIELELLF